MKILFSKYQGTGNDFVLIDNRNNIVDKNNTKLISELCDRKFGVGSDGLMLLENDNEYDFRMRYYNCDGFEASMCGNGGRCIVAFAHKLGVFNNKTVFIAIDGEHEASISKIKNKIDVSIKMQNVNKIDIRDKNYFLNTGSPHYVEFTNNTETLDTYARGQEIRYSDRFKQEGTNVNFVKIQGKNKIEVLTYERGVEDETLSCGTGVVASAISTFIKLQDEKKFAIKTKGGNLEVKFDYTDNNKFENIWLTGPAEHVFDGEIDK